MSIEKLTIGDPFFSVKIISDEPHYQIEEATIILNLSDQNIKICEQFLGELQSLIVKDISILHVNHAVVIEGFSRHEDESVLMEQIRQSWPSAYEVRGEERLRGVEHYMSPKIWLGQFGFTLYHSQSVPLNVGLHKDHSFCPVPGFREVHTQIIGFGKMQQCRKQNIDTLYLEEYMAPGNTHRPMYDEMGNYPWHQYETITPSVFMAIEMLPDGATPPA